MLDIIKKEEQPRHQDAPCCRDAASIKEKETHWSEVLYYNDIVCLPSQVVVVKQSKGSQERNEKNNYVDNLYFPCYHASTL